MSLCDPFNSRSTVICKTVFFFFKCIHSNQSADLSRINYPKVADTNLSEAEGHGIWVVVLRDKNGSHKVSEFVSQPINNHKQQAEAGNQGLQEMMRWKAPYC